MPPPKMDDPFALDRLNGAADFHPEWDIPTLGKEFTDSFSAAISEVRARPQLDPKRKIHAFVGPAGYGKTHLFGRLRHTHEGSAYFSFIAAPPGLDPAEKDLRLETTVRWQFVESLLSSSDTCAPFRIELARLLVPSFKAYFDRLSRDLRTQFATVRNNLEGEEAHWTILDFFGRVEALGPYHQLADAVESALPNCPGPVIRALVMSVSPAGDDARRWLRGDADQMADDRVAALRLLDRGGQALPSPPLIELLIAVASLLRIHKISLVLCFDQLEELFKNDRAGFSALTGQLMTWLQSVPNLLIGLGCMSDVWSELRGAQGFKSFLDRVTVYRLRLLSGAEAAELVARRMKSWTEFDPIQPPGSPFDLESVRAYAARLEPPPRGFIQDQCGPRFTEWLTSRRQGTIRLTGPDPDPPLTELFRQEWTKTLDALRAKKTVADDIEEADLWAGALEALQIAKQGGIRTEGFRIDELLLQPIVASQNDSRPSVRIFWTANGKSASVLLAVSKKDGGVAFGKWLEALNSALVETDTGAVIVWPKRKLSVGEKTAAHARYKARLAEGMIRPFPLDDHEATFHQLECLRRITRGAGIDLILKGNLISKEECRHLIIETGLLANLKLFDFLFLNWKGIEVSAPGATLPTQPVPVAPAESILNPPPASPLALPSPASEQTWPELMLKKAADYLKKKGQAVHAVGTEIGPTFVRFKFELRGDADFSKVRRQSENLKIELKLDHEPLIASQAGYISIDVQRPDREIVLLPPLLAKCPPKLAGEPVVPAGVGVSGNVEWLNLSEPDSCHLLVAGTTGSGKSEFLRAMLAALAARLPPEQIRFHLIDPKRVTFNVDASCPYLGGPVAGDGAEAIPILEECVEEMESRYRLLKKRGKDHIQQLVGADSRRRWIVVFDEFADMMSDKTTKKVLEPLLQRLGAKARAAGIHLILGTQRPEASVVTPLLRANLPGRIGFKVASEKESKLFLDEPDAAYLFGKGDLVWKRGGGLIRLQSPCVPKEEFDRYLKVI